MAQALPLQSIVTIFGGNCPSHDPILKTVGGEKSNVYTYDIAPRTADLSRLNIQTKTRPSNGQLVPNYILFHENYN